MKRLVIYIVLNLSPFFLTAQYDRTITKSSDSVLQTMAFRPTGLFDAKDCSSYNAVLKCMKTAIKPFESDLKKMSNEAIVFSSPNPYKPLTRKDSIQIGLMKLFDSSSCHWIDFYHFNQVLMDSILYIKINAFRVKLGLRPYKYSKTVSKYISSRNTLIMYQKGYLHHPNFPWETDEALKQNVKCIFKEHLILLDSSFINCEFSSPYKLTCWENLGYTEVALSIPRDYYKFYNLSSYESIAERAVIAWYESLPHRAILLSECFDPNDFFVGVSLRFCPNGYFYAAANVIAF